MDGWWGDVAITARNVDRLQHVAVSRLTLFVAGQIHALIEPFQRWLADEVRQAANDEGLLETGKGWQVLNVAGGRWREVMQRYTALLTAARIQAGDIAFTSLRVKNNARLPAWVTKGTQEGRIAGDQVAVSLLEAFRPALPDWVRLVRMWGQRRDWALRAAQERVWGDGLVLSQRIWRLEAGGLAAIRQTLASGMVGRTSAWELAQALEAQLGANADFPRWTRLRLMGLSPQERAEDLSGLLRAGDVLQPWQSRGVSYNALRLARNEIQIANHAVTSEIARNFPGIVGRKSRLSPSHPKVDICDEYAAGGPYAVTENFLPLHPQCVTPGQLVDTLRGAVAIEDVSVGDWVLTHKGRYGLVTAAWSRRHNDQVFEIETDAGRFELTGNHPVLLSRGWVNAESVQPGDQVVYAGVGVLANGGRRVAENTPSVSGKPGVTTLVSGGAAMVPAGAIAFDGDLVLGDGEVDEVASNLVFTVKGDASGSQRIQESLLGDGGIVDPTLAQGLQHRYQAGVGAFLSLGDFAPNVGALGNVGADGKQAAIGGDHSGSGGGRTFTGVFEPLVFDSLAASAQGDVIGGQQFTQDAVCEGVAFEDFWRGKALLDVDSVQKIGNRDAVLGFDAESLKFDAGDVMHSEMGARPSLHLQAANGACNGHDNLLSLSPGDMRGAEPGRSVVRGVANPSQALLYYATVRRVVRRDYAGPVFNMTVAGDNSYTVNGHAVHNCLCFYEEVLMPPKEFAAQVRGWMAGENEFLDGYVGWLDQRAAGPWPATLDGAGLAVLWEAMGRWLSGDVDTMATVLKV